MYNKASHVSNERIKTVTNLKAGRSISSLPYMGCVKRKKKPSNMCMCKVSSRFSIHIHSILSNDSVNGH